MLDEYERGMPEARIDDLFDQVKDRLVPLIAQINASPQPSLELLSGNFPLDKQDGLNAAIASSLGYSGRRDVSLHPFSTSSSPLDVRITSRFSESEWYQGLAGTVHEIGHAFYESGMHTEPIPANSALSMGTHESQSLFWEVRVYDREAVDR